MEKYERRAHTCLYFGIMMALIAADWHWYASRFPDESFVLTLPFIEGIYLAWLVLMALWFAGWGVCWFKVRRCSAASRRGDRKRPGKR